MRTFLIRSLFPNNLLIVKNRRYYIYKIPSSFIGKTKPKASDKTGLMYVYITSDSPKDAFKLSDRSFNDLKSMPGQTLSQAYFDSKKIDRLVIAYSDQPPNKKASSKKGHLKGVVVADKRSGFWLVHSVPQYPDLSLGKFSSNFFYFITNYMISNNDFFPTFEIRKKNTITHRLE